jgi:hypothetical protein
MNSAIRDSGFPPSRGDRVQSSGLSSVFDHELDNVRARILRAQQSAEVDQHVQGEALARDER